MMNTNMRRILKTPTLRMMDGGDIQVPKGPGLDRAGFLARNPGVIQNQLTSPGALPVPAPASVAPTPLSVSPILRDGNSFSQAPGSQGAMPTSAPPALAAPVDQGAAMDRKMLAASAAAAPTPTGVSPMPARAAPSTGGRQARLQAASSAVSAGLAAANQEPERPLMQFKDGGSLRTGQGGHVPGTGHGDKIDAKYEPGEFVVSNAMLDAEPGLREQLHGLRTSVLAEKGVTPEQADAKAVSGGTLRAESGGLFPYNRPEKDIYAGLGKSASAPENTPKPSGMLAPQQTRGMDGQTQDTVAGDGPANSGGATGGWGDTGSAAGSGGRRTDSGPPPNASRVFNAAKSELEDSLRAGRYAGAAGTAVRGALGTAVGLGADTYNKFAGSDFGSVARPAEDFGRAVVGMEGRKATAPAAPAAPTQQNPAQADFRRSELAAMPGQDPGRAAAEPKTVHGTDGRQYLPEAVSDSDRLRSDGLIKQAFSRDEKRVTEQNAEQGNLAFGRNGMNDGINTLRSEPKAMDLANQGWAARGAGVKASLDSKGGLVLSNSTGPEKMQYTDRAGNPTSQYENTAQFDNGQKQLAAATASLRNPDGSKWSANDNALMAANIRDGIDPTAGTSRAPAPTQMSPLRARLESLGSSKMNKTQAATLLSLRQADQQHESATAQNATRSKDAAATNETALRGQDMKLQGEREQAAGVKANALAAKAEADRKYELDVTRLGIETANKNRDDKRAGEEAFAKRIGGMVGNDKDGTAAAGVVNAANLFLGDSIRAAEAELKTNPSNAKALRDLGRLKKEGVNALDDKMISELVLGRQAASTAQDYDGYGPWAGKAKNSAAPIKTLSLKKGIVFDDYVSDDASGNQVIPARALKDRPDLNRLVVQ